MRALKNLISAACVAGLMLIGGSALAAGVPTGSKCGGIAGRQCSARGVFCKRPIGQCQVADAQGVCTKKPQICTQDVVPVCGCNGKTYSNACMADKAGVRVAATGACKAKT
jgi:hypothetical protein